jgi:peptidoglycan/xylan/chitin deacetylase (PgdA/CDA1 family)
MKGILFFVFFVLAVSLALAGCGNPVIAASQPTGTPVMTASPLPTVTASQTPSPTPTSTPFLSPTPTRVVQGPDAVTIPILLYHRIAVSPINSQYYVPPGQFEMQIKLLHDWEYTVIPLDLLIKAIREGASLPPRPVIITFDDGDISVYTDAFPVMQAYGYTGVAYIVGNYMGTDGYMDETQVKELAAAGWEIGSHSRSHRDLTKLEPEIQRVEIVQARKDLQERIGVPVESFAYPFGLISSAVVDYTKFAGYTSAMGLGFTSDQGKSNLFWLQRRDVKGGYDIRQFAAFLPWQGDPGYLPTDTLTPSASPSATPEP